MSNDERGPGEDRRDEFEAAAAGGRTDQRRRQDLELEELRNRVERERQLRERAEQDLQRERQRAEQDLQRERQRAEQDLQRERQLRERERQRTDELRNGTYYSSIDQIWGFQLVPFGAADEVPLRRDPTTDPPNLHWTQSSAFTSKYSYQETRIGAQAENFEAVDDVSKSRTSHGTRAKREIWPYNVFGGKSGDVAHLLPAAPDDALTWHMVAEWVLGLEDVEWKHVKLAVNGFKAPLEQRRREGTGIKHFTANKMKLNNQRTYMDINPCVIILPILTVNQVKNWNGEGYDAIVAADEWTDQEMGDICTSIGMKDIGPEATREEVGICTDLLSQVVRGMAHRVLDRRQNPAKLSELPQQVRDFDSSTDTISFSVRDTAPTVKVPIANVCAFKVRKISFNGQTTGPGDDTNRGHIAPDPLILTAKAACVWSTRRGERLVAGGEIEDDDFSEGDIIAAEAYIAAQEANEASLRPHSREDLARGLHQLNGYQAGVLGS